LIAPAVLVQLATQLGCQDSWKAKAGGWREQDSDVDDDRPKHPEPDLNGPDPGLEKLTGCCDPARNPRLDPGYLSWICAGHLKGRVLDHARLKPLNESAL
jgi:hypothetical protein